MYQVQKLDKTYEIVRGISLVATTAYLAIGKISHVERARQSPALVARASAYRCRSWNIFFLWNDYVHRLYTEYNIILGQTYFIMAMSGAGRPK